MHPSSEIESGETPIHTDPVARRPREWRRQFDPEMAHTTFYAEVNLGLIDTLKVGTATWVTTPPREYLARRRAMNAAKAHGGDCSRSAPSLATARRRAG
jgi:hypothetical protein